MKALYFLKWLFNWNKWYGFQKRYSIYAIVGFSIALITGNSNLVWLPAIFIWLDFTVSLIKEKWDNFNKEQEQMLKDISQEKQ